MRRQLRPLERQADAARRHGDVVAELTALRLFLAGRDLNGLRNRAASIAAVRADEATRERTLVGSLARFDADVTIAEAAMVAAEGGSGGRHRRDVLADDVAWAEGLRERARGLAALMAERQRSLERVRSAELDADLIATLETEDAQVTASLVDVENEAGRLVPEVRELAAAEAALALERAAVGDDGPVEAGPRAAGASEVRGELTALRSSAERGAAERRRAEDRRALAAKVLRLGGETSAAAGELQGAEHLAVAAAEAAELAVLELGAADAALEDAESAYEAAAGRHREWTARVDALAEARDEARARAGAERLASLAGLVGTLLELVDVDPGWESAFAAAIGEAAAAVVVEDVDAARSALLQLHQGAAGGAVLALDGAVIVPVVMSVPGATAVRDRVRASIPAVRDLLDRLLIRAVVVDGPWTSALDVALAHPELTVVTREGDRFAPTGWRAGAGTTVATGAALEEAHRQATDAAAETDAARSARVAARRVAVAARAAVADTGRDVDRIAHGRTDAAATLERLERERRDVEVEVEAVAGHLAELTVRLQRDSARIADLEGALPALEAEEAAGLERAAAGGRRGVASSSARPRCARSAPTSRYAPPPSRSAVPSSGAVTPSSRSDSNGIAPSATRPVSVGRNWPAT